jgi:hypothetical protein
MFPSKSGITLGGWNRGDLISTQGRSTIDLKKKGQEANINVRRHTYDLSHEIT